MALGAKVLDIMFDLYEKNFFKDINSVIDMGDQDIFGTYNEIETRFRDHKIKFIDIMFDKISLSK